MKRVSCRKYAPKDYHFLREMLFEAVFWSRAKNLPSLEEGLSYDYTKHILEGFGERKGDTAVIAEVDSIPAGAAFIRYWSKNINMRGYISHDIPVLVIGVAKQFRRQGIGNYLLRYLKSVAKEKGINKISLCVTKSNIAYHLYTKHSFKIVEDIDSSYNMIWE
ncbi:GNAT family N-acetyltransferase [Alkaliphilus serpentinus]|uniref:GNAT family N-acetyltransferase n=1 Tax=Alkaliphilus serpentinus TaxID=1482731 RepID=A0A833HL73_9FIRM|nr:N-acetyltransferase [Alkaliphilus serpentinus]KAB3525499.1 GNAT family N-acetyltransferase [Alkaliphilus serpentinus]